MLFKHAVVRLKLNHWPGISDVHSLLWFQAPVKMRKFPTRDWGASAHESVGVQPVGYREFEFK